MSRLTSEADSLRCSSRVGRGNPRRQRAPRRGFALIAVMVLIILVSLGVYSYAQLMSAQEAGTVMSGRRLQARAAVASGVEYLKDYLTLAAEDRLAVGGHWDNPSFFQDVAVSIDGMDNLRFSVISVDDDQYGDPTEIRYGLTDEGSKLNVNFLVSEAYNAASSDPFDAENAQNSNMNAEDALAAMDAAMGDEESEPSTQARDALMALPGMTLEIADSILDWIDEDDEPREYGAEFSAYGALGYEPRNGPVTSLDELLLVQGVTSELLYGADRNHNGLLEDNEQSVTVPVGDGSASMSRGWSAYLTAHSQDIVEQAEETIDLNQDDLETLYGELTDAGFTADFASYVVVYRQSGAYQPEIPADAPDDFELPEPESISGREVDFSKNGQTEIESVLDLLGTSSEGQFVVAGRSEPETVLVASPYADSSQLGTVLPQMMSLLAAGELGGTSGVNTNQCGAAVMGGLPNLESDLVEAVLQLQDRRGDSGDANYLYPTWPLGTGAVSIEQMKQLLPFVAGQGTVFRAQIIGYSDVPGVYARAEVVIDASGDTPQLVSWRDLSHLGLGFSLDTLTQ